MASTYTVALSADHAEFIAAGARTAGHRVDLDRDAFATTREVVVTLGEAAFAHFSTVDSETDGVIADGQMWIEGYGYPVTVLA